MKLTGIISIAGKPGLSKIVTQSKNGIIVESLIDGKRFPVQGSQRVSSLDDISIYTYEEDVLLGEVFEKIYKKEAGKEAISHKTSEAELKAYIKEILPNYDAERVYNSDLKKIVQWYNLLLGKDLLKIEEEEKEEKGEDKKQTTAKKETKPKKATTAKKAAPKKPTAAKGGAKITKSAGRGK
ncbi:MAG: hypothetical protein DWP98_02850 [Bacteroidetes bacterium]|nr:MAG: hypothetical protein DWP98_02850 [Bacteroidota bacterium]MBL1145579.1 hypothetical protein [Bacteroidota bacterium]NOG58375.1 DUF5606 domain-containing protein [Bacteroidota bacterium]